MENRKMYLSINIRKWQEEDNFIKLYQFISNNKMYSRDYENDKDTESDESDWIF